MQRRGRLAVVGLSFRFPGPGGEGFWQALCEGRDLVTEVDDTRWSKEAYLHPSADEPGRSFTFAAGSVGDVSGFDAAFFGISPREAAQIDPQQRWLLELTWEALEGGAIRPSSLRGTRTAVMIGFSGSDYGYRHADDLDSVDGFFMTGSSASIAANRVSYFYDFRGPSLAIDTACSSALTAVHFAAQSLHAGESDIAVTGAVNLHLHPLPFIAFSKASMLARGGRSRAFDASGDGYVRSEGGVVLVLKRLDDALAHGNRVYAVLEGSAVNCDGKTSGLTVPSAAAQAALLKDVYAHAGIAPEEIDYVEAHGTGTAVGDPIEARALGEALGRARPPGRPLRIGSVKASVGHMETVAGMAGMVKALFCLRHRAVPGSLHFQKPNPHIPFADLNLEVVRGVQPLGDGERHVIGVNSFGFGGANGHVILASAPPAPERAVARPRHAVPLPLSGRSEKALAALASRLAAWMQDQPQADLYDIAYTAANHRDWLKHRAVIYADNCARAMEQLALLGEGKPSAATATGTALECAAGPVFLYSGNGAQWAGMGRRLMEEEPVFRATFAQVDALFQKQTSESLSDLLMAADLEERIDATEIAQPLLFAVQAGITELMRSHGIAPAAVLGHSVGEIAAAWACGALTLEDAVRIVFYRSALQARTRGAGGMCAVRMPLADLSALLAQCGLDERIAIAAVNSPRSATVAGAAGDLDRLEEALGAQERGSTRLALDYAFHSRAMDIIEPAIVPALGSIRPRAAEIPFVSAVTGRSEDGTLLEAGYWWRNIREPVRFAGAMDHLRERGYTVFVEIGPKPILGGYVAECLGAALRDCRIIATMAPGADGSESLRRRAAEAAIAGCAFDLARFFPVAVPPVDLPTYPWQRERHWYEPSPGSRGVMQQRAPHPLLGSRLPGDAAEWESRIDATRLPEFADHRVGGELMFPAAGFAELALAACAALRQSGALEIEDLVIHAPLVLASDRSRTVRLSVDDDDGRLRIRSRATTEDGSWRLHATGRLPLGIPRPADVPSFARPQAGTLVESGPHYAALAALGLDYGPVFQTVARAWVEEEAVSAEIFAPVTPSDEVATQQLSPCVLDACFQLIVHMQRPEPDGSPSPAFVPVRIGRLSLLRPGATVAFASIRQTRRGPRSAQADCVLYGAGRDPIAILRGVRFRALPRREESQVVAMRTRAIARPLPGPRRVAILPPAERLTGSVLARLHHAERLEARRHYYEVVEPLLEAVLAAFAQETVKALEGRPPAAPEAQQRLQRVRRLAGELDLPPAAEIWTELMADCADHSAEVLRLGQIGARLGDIVRDGGELEPLRVEASGFAAGLARLAAEVMAAIPCGERLRVLVLQPEGSDLGTHVAAHLQHGRADCTVRSTAGAAIPGEEPFDLVFFEADWRDDPVAAIERLRPLLQPHGMVALLLLVPGRGAALAEWLVQDVALPQPSAMLGQGSGIRERWRGAAAASALVEEALIEDMPGAGAGPFAFLLRAEPAAATAVPAQPPAQEGTWLIAPASTPHSRSFAERLRAELLQRDASATVLGAQPGAAPRWSEIVEELRRSHGGIAGIVELPGLTGGEAHAPRDLLARQAARCESLGNLLEACNAQSISAPAWIVTERSAVALLPPESRDRGGDTVADDAPLRGFVRSAANEYPGLTLRTADLADPQDAEAMASDLADTLLASDGEDEILLASAGRFVPRIEATPLAQLGPVPPVGGAREAIVLEIAQPGQLKHLGWVRRPLRALVDDEVEIEVQAAGLNFRDVMYAMGHLSEEALETGFAGLTLGMELAGVVAATGPAVKTIARGERVIAFAGASFATRVVTRAGFVLKMPERWSFEAGATVPTAFLTAYYALNQLAHLQNGESLLIHGAAGGVGMAAIQLARNAGAEIFATAGTDMKRDLARLLGADHVFDSRSLDFADQILGRTGGRGVDVVLNSLAGEAMQRSLQLVAPLGRFLELGKRDYDENSRVGLRPFRNNVAYFGIDLDQLMRERPAFVRRMVQDLLALFEEGTLSPLPYRAFAAADAEAAFRCMQQSRHVGKIVLRLDPPPRADSTFPFPAPRLQLPSHATYLVTGGLGGFGLRTAQRLAGRGARHLVLTGRSEPGPRAAEFIRDLREAGIEVRAERCDAADLAAMQGLMETVRRELPPLRGIVHAAGVFSDGLIRNLDRKRIEEVLVPKVVGALNLHRLTQGVPLDFFVLYSSATFAFGSAGQSNYVAANAFLEALAEVRRARRQPALCVGWGPIADAGYLERNPEIRAQVAARLGDSALTSEQALDALERLIAADLSGLAILKVSRASLARLAAAARASRFKTLVELLGDAPSSAVESGEIERWLAEFDEAGLSAMLADLLRKEAAGVLRMPAEKIEPSQPLHELGFDSLMGVELITAVEARFGVSIPVVAVNEIGSLDRLAARVAKELRRGRERAAAPADALDAQARRLAALHNRDMDGQEVTSIAANVRESTDRDPPAPAAPRPA